MSSTAPILGLAIYWMVIALMMIGLYTMIARENLIKKIMGLSLFQSSAILFYITMAKVEGGTAPILIEGDEGEALYSNPLPDVLMLTAIVVGVATLALALALVVRIQDRYETVEEDEISVIDRRDSVSSALNGSGR